MNGEYDKEISEREYNEAVKDFAKKKLEDSLPYPWCHLPEKCSVSGRCEKQFLPNGVNCGE